jgi:hypothetical protein
LIARVELECAMAAIITSKAAKAEFAAEPAEFAVLFGLSATQTAQLRRMGPDLVALTDSFVAKRATTMRWNAKRTLALLGPASGAAIQEFIDLYPATESFRDEARRFGDFMIERTAAARDGSVRADVIAEMARFESSRSASFWGAVAEIDPRRDLARPKVLRPRSGATVESFGRDLRLLYHDTTMAVELSEPDECTLGFVHLGASGFRVLRLGDLETRLVQSLGNGEQADLLDADTASMTNRLVRGGVLVWA